MLAYNWSYDISKVTHSVYVTRSHAGLILGDIYDISKVTHTRVYMLPGHMLAYNEHEIVPRPEESRVTRVEKNERINKQLKVRTHSLLHSRTF